MENFVNCFRNHILKAWLFFLAGITYALFVPTGHASLVILIPTAILGVPLLIHFAHVSFGDDFKD